MSLPFSCSLSETQVIFVARFSCWASPSAELSNPLVRPRTRWEMCSGHEMPTCLSLPPSRPGKWAEATRACRLPLPSPTLLPIRSSSNQTSFSCWTTLLHLRRQPSLVDEGWRRIRRSSDNRVSGLGQNDKGFHFFFYNLKQKSGSTVPFSYSCSVGLATRSGSQSHFTPSRCVLEI